MQLSKALALAFPSWARMECYNLPSILQDSNLKPCFESFTLL